MTVPESNVTVVRPIMLDIIKQVCEITKISPDLMIYYPGETESVAQKGSTLSEQVDERDNTRLHFNSNITVEVNEEYNEGSIGSTNVTSVGNLPVFMDNNVGVLIRPAYSSTNVSISFRYSSDSKTSAERWRDDIRMRLSMSRDINLHQLTYGYPIPLKFIDILREIYTNREAVDGYGQTFEEYLQIHSSTRMTVASNQSGTVSALTVAEKQIRVQGLFDFEIAPEKSTREGNSSVWVSTFNYNFKYDKPVFCNMTYPVMVHNQLLSYNSIPKDPAYDLDKVNKSFTSGGADLYQFEAATVLGKYYDFTAPVRIPVFDEFIPDVIPFGTEPFVTALCAIDPSDRRLLLDLNDLDTYELDSDVLAFIKAIEWQYLTKPFKSIIHASVYRSMSLANHQDVSINSALEIRTNWDLSLRLNHRVRLSLVKDLTLLDKDALKRLLQYPKAGAKLLKGINVNSGDLVQVRRMADLTAIAPNLPPVGESWNSLKNNIPFMKTLNISQIIAAKQT